MSINSIGFPRGDGFDSAGLRKPNEGEFKKVYPGSGLPLPHKEAGDVVTYDLVVSDGIVVSAGDSLTIEIDAIVDTLALSDGASSVVADSIALLQEHNLVTADGAVVASCDTVELSGESDLAVDDGANISFGDVLSLVQEHNLDSEHAAVTAAADEPTLEGVPIEHVLAVEDGAQASVCDAISLTVQAVAVTFKRRRVHVPYPVPVPVIEKEKEPEKIVHVLSVKNAAVHCGADKVVVYEIQILGVGAPGAMLVRTGTSVVRLEQKRRRRFVQEDEILLMAA